MDDDWEELAENEIPPILPNVNKWEGEDEDEDVKESWEDEEEKKDEEKVEVKVAYVKPKKVTAEKKQKQSSVENENISAEDKIAEKLRLQKIQEEEDLKTALETFGITERPCGIEAMHPTKRTEYTELANAISKKVSEYKNAEEFTEFVEEMIRNFCVHLNTPDMRKIKVTVENIYLEKQKIDKEKMKKPAGKGKTKIKLRVDDNVKSNNINNYEYDYDYDDFM